MNVNELEGAELDAAVAKAEGLTPWHDGWEWKEAAGEYLSWFQPSTRWDQGGPIIERERIAIAWAADVYRRHGITGPSSGWEASIAAPTDECKDWRLFAYAETPLVAAMRAFVASRQT